MAEPMPSNGPEKDPLAETIWALVRVRDAVAGQNAPFIELLIIEPPRVIDAIDVSSEIFNIHPFPLIDTSARIVKHVRRGNHE